MSGILSGFTEFAGVKTKKDDDIVDRLSSRYTVALLLGCLAVVTIQNLGGFPMKCWVPVHFTGSWTKYTNSYCWVNNTYYNPMNPDYPHPQDTESRQKIIYYQWVPFILIAQAAMFYFPSVVWHGLNQRGGIDSDHILSSANSLLKAQQEENRDGILVIVCNQIHRFLGTRRRGDRGFRKKVKGMFFSSRFGSYLVIIFVVSKLLYIANAVSQFFVLSRLLAFNYFSYGIDLLRGIPMDDDYAPYHAFPKVTYCDIGIRRLGFNQQYAVQCALPLNLLHERIYQIIWFWTMGVVILSVVALFVWLFRFTFRGDRVMFIRNHLWSGKRITRESEKETALLNDFVDNYLQQDGAFLLRLIAHNTNNITTTDIICKLWDTWKDDMHTPLSRVGSSFDGDEKGSDESLAPMKSID